MGAAQEAFEGSEYDVVGLTGIGLDCEVGVRWFSVDCHCDFPIWKATN